METPHHNPRAKPRGLLVPCSVCASNVPYNPTSPISLCTDCRQEATAPDNQATNALMFTSRVRTGYCSNPSPMTPPSSLKRRGEFHADGVSSRKRPLTMSYGNSNRSLGPAAEGYGRSVIDLEEDDDDDKFEDAPEVLPPKANEEYEYHDVASITKRTPQNGEGEVASFVIEDGDSKIIEPASNGTAPENSDLFSSTFENKPSQESEDETEDENGDEEAMQEEEKSEGGDNENDHEDEGQLSSTNPEEESNIDTSTGIEDLGLEDENGNKIAHGHQSVPKNSYGSTKATAGPTYPDWDHDPSVNFKRLQNFHNRAKDLIPRLPLPGHRYWIGVLNMDVNPKTFNQEKHFTWMKGNRLSTVETVWHTYQATTATENFVLLLGSERLDFKDKMEELDYFSDKKVIFRAVDEEAPVSEGRSLIEGIIPPATGTEVIEID